MVESGASSSFEADDKEKRFYAPPLFETHKPEGGMEDLGPAPLFGLRISLRTIRHLKHENNWEPEKYIQEYDSVAEYFTSYFEEVIRSGQTPAIIPGNRSLTVARLGLLPNSDRALYTGPVTLEPGSAYPINYWGKHWVSPEARRRDSIPETPDYCEWYIGYCSERQFDMSGYAISFKHLIHATKSGMTLGAISSGLA